jgi:hypothetical protein
MVLYSVVALAIVFALAAVVVGREARRLDAVAPRPTFDLDEAVEWVAKVRASLSHDDVRKIIDWNLEYFRMKGVSGNGHSTVPEGPVVVGGAETVDYVLNKEVEVGPGDVRLAGSLYTSPQVHAVLDAQMSYLEAIGAIGPEAPPEEGLEPGGPG